MPHVALPGFAVRPETMFNRYVDGLATWTPRGHELYDRMGHRMAHQGHVPPAAPAVTA